MKFYTGDVHFVKLGRWECTLSCGVCSGSSAGSCFACSIFTAAQRAKQACKVEGAAGADIANAMCDTKRSYQHSCCTEPLSIHTHATWLNKQHAIHCNAATTQYATNLHTCTNVSKSRIKTGPMPCSLVHKMYTTLYDHVGVFSCYFLSPS